jgi:CelD/BcsL family acetyltransferase involved in cellulose biosynthesis
VSCLELIQLRSIAELRSVAPAWDDLWARSDCELPNARAEMIAQWLEQFAPHSRLVVLIVTDGDRMLAALPLVSERLKRVVTVGNLTGNAWSPCGELLVDRDRDCDAILSRLVDGVVALPWPLVWFNTIPLEAWRWQALASAAQKRGLEIASKQRYRIAQLDIEHDWEAYLRGRSRSHRRAMRRAADRAEKAGGVDLRVFSPPAADDIDRLMQRGFAVEDRSWKGAAGTSVLRSPGMFEFLCRQAHQFAAWRQLELIFLEHRGKAIAFQYGCTAKGVYFTYKIGYDPEFAEFAPGQLIRWLLFERFQSEPARRVVDFIGPLTQATAKWATRTYAIGRLVIAPPRLLSRAMLRGYAAWEGRFGRPCLEPSTRSGRAESDDAEASDNRQPVGAEA